MKIIDKYRFFKTIIYRISATLVAQTISWFLTHNLTVNAIVLVTDVVSTLWYYTFETIYKRVDKNGKKS